MRQDALENFLAAAQTPVELTAGERDVQEKADVNIGQTLTQQAWQQEKIIVVNHDDVARFVDLEDLVGEHLVHPVIVGPCLSCGPAISRLILLVVEKGVKLLLGELAPARLVLKHHHILVFVQLVIKPHRDYSAAMVALKLLFQAQTVLSVYADTLHMSRLRRLRIRIDRDGRGSFVQRGGASGAIGACSSITKNGLGLRGNPDLAGPSNQSVIPGRCSGGKVRKRIEQGGSAASGPKFLRRLN